MTPLAEIPTEELIAEIRRRSEVTSPQRGSILHITQTVAGVFGVSAGELLGPTRKGPIKEARFAAWLILRDRGYLSSEIASAYHRLDAGTIRHGCHQARAWLKENRTYSLRIKQALELVS